MASSIAVQRSHPTIFLKANVFLMAGFLLLLSINHHIVSASSPHAAAAPGVDGDAAGVLMMGAGAVGLKEDVRAGLRDADLTQNFTDGGSAQLKPETPPSAADPPLPCVPSSMCVPNSASQSVASRSQPAHAAGTTRRRRFFTPAEWPDYNAREFRLINNIQMLREQLAERLRDAIGEEQWSKTEMKVVPIARRKAENFTFEDFYTNFASKGLPVVIENANFSRVPFTIDFWTRTCGDKLVRPTVMAQNSTGGWGQLIKLPEIKLAEFVDRVMKPNMKNDSAVPSNATKGFNAEDPTWGGKKLHPGARPYVFDWSLPHYCPEAVKDFIVPKYFAQDFFQNLHPKMYENVNVQNFRESWPSLFIGPKGAQSAMHIDSAGTSFWMGMMSGKKHWRIFPHSRHLLYEEEGWTFAVDALKPDYEKFPLMKMAVAYDAFITEGDAIYVPGGSPHKVVTLEDGVSLSMNFFDHAVRVSAMQINMDTGDFPAMMLRALLDHPELPTEPKLDGYGNEDQPWDSYKKPPVMVHHDGNCSLAILLDDKEPVVWDAMARGDRFLILWAQDAWVANIVLPSLWRLFKGWREGQSKAFPLSYVGKDALHIRRLIPPVSQWWSWAMRMADHQDKPNTDSSYWIYVKDGCMNITIMPWENTEEEIGGFMRDTDAMIAKGHCFPVHTTKNDGSLWRYVTYFRTVSMISDLTGVDMNHVFDRWKQEIDEFYGMFSGETCSLKIKVAYAMSLCIAAVLHIAFRAAWRLRKNLRASNKVKGKAE